MSDNEEPPVDPTLNEPPETSFAVDSTTTGKTGEEPPNITDEDEGDTYALAKPSVLPQPIQESSVRAIHTRKQQVCPSCGQSYEMSLHGCPDCGWTRRQRRRQHTASWLSILLAGFNVRIVANNAAAMVSPLIGLSVLAGAFLFIVRFTYFAPSPGLDDVAFLLLFSVLIGLYWASLFYRKFFQVLKASARGVYETDSDDNQHGLLFFLLYGVAVTIQVSPVVALAMMGMDQLQAQQESAWAAALGGAAAVCVSGFASMYLLSVTLTSPVLHAFNPVQALRWIMRCPLSISCVLVVNGIWSVLLMAVAIVCSALTVTGAAALIGGEWADLPALEKQLADSIQESPGEPAGEEKSASLPQVETVARAVVEHPEILRAELDRIVERVRVSEERWLFFVAAFFVNLIVVYFHTHACFTFARILGLFARRYQSRLDWSTN